MLSESISTCSFSLLRLESNIHHIYLSRHRKSPLPEPSRSSLQRGGGYPPLPPSAGISLAFRRNASAVPYTHAGTAKWNRHSEDRKEHLEGITCDVIWSRKQASFQQNPGSQLRTNGILVTYRMQLRRSRLIQAHHMTSPSHLRGVLLRSLLPSDFNSAG